MRHSRWLDVLCVAALVATGVLQWPSGELTLPVLGPEAPAWGTVRDALLDGPDAGEWARSMLAFYDGRYQDLATHRLPTWVLVVNGAMSIEPDVARAGHLANHLMNLVLGLSVFAIGRLWGQRWVGLAAGVIAMTTTHAIGVSLRFGVDAVIVAAIPLSIAAAILACRKWWLGPVSGLVAGLVTATHFSTLPYALPALAVILMCGGKGTRWLAALGHVLGTMLMIWLLTLTFPVATFEDFQVSIANGIAPGYQGNGRVSSWATAMQVINEGMGTALNRSVAQLMVQIRPSWLPWQPGLILPWIGVLGIGLKRTQNQSTHGPGWLARWWARTDLGMGIGLLFCLAPLPVFAAAQAPLRYGDNLLAIGAVLLVRGMISVVWMATDLVRSSTIERVRPWLYAALAGLLAYTAVRDSEPNRRPLYPTIEELGYWQLGEALKDHFKPGDGVASPVREALIQGRLQYCPQRICPIEATEEAFWLCLGVHEAECDGTGPVGYVVTDADLYDPNAVSRRDMDAWVAANWTPVHEIDLERFSASIFAITRDEIPDLPPPTVPAPEGGSGEIPGLPSVGRPMEDILTGDPDEPSGAPSQPPLGEDGKPIPGPVEPTPGHTVEPPTP